MRGKGVFFCSIPHPGKSLLRRSAEAGAGSAPPPPPPKRLPQSQGGAWSWLPLADAGNMGPQPHKSLGHLGMETLWLHRPTQQPEFL